MNSWQKLQDEVNLWQQPITFWWRDDDAIEDTPSLRKMLSIAKNYKTPVHLAVIPKQLQDSLDIIKEPEYIDYSYVLQHGFEHTSFALPEQRKIELGGSQDTSTLLNNLSLGRNLLKESFHQQYLDILVPPWNRIDEHISAGLPEIGYKKLSVLGGKKVAENEFHYNVHIDIINWKKREFAGEEVIIDKIISHLQDKRLSHTDSKACGLMTHHLDHDDLCWRFLTDFFDFCQQNPTIKWLSGPMIIQA